MGRFHHYILNTTICFLYVGLIPLLVGIWSPGDLIQILLHIPRFILNFTTVALWCFIKLNKFIGILIILDSLDRFLKLLHRVFWAKTSLFEVNAPVYSRDGTVLSAIFFLIHATSYLVLYSVLRLFNRVCNTEAMAFNWIWGPHYRSYVDLLKTYLWIVMQYIKAIGIWLFTGIPPRMQNMLRYWLKTVSVTNIPVIYTPYLDRIAEIVKKHRIFYVEGRFQLNMYTRFRKFGSGDGSKRSVIEKFHSELDSYATYGVDKEIAQAARLVRASRPPFMLAKTKREVSALDNMYKTDVEYQIKPRRKLLDFNREADLAREYRLRLNNIVRLYGKQIPAMPKQVEFNMLKTEGSPCGHPTLTNFIKLKIHGWYWTSHMSFTSNLSGIWTAYEKRGDRLLLSAVNLGNFPSVSKRGAQNPGAILFTNPDIVNPSRQVIVGEPTENPKLEIKFRDSVLVKESFDALLILSRRQKLDNFLSGQSSEASLIFTNRELDELLTEVQNSIDEIQIPGAADYYGLPPEVTHAMFFIREYDTCKGVLVDTKPCDWSSVEDLCHHL